MAVREGLLALLSTGGRHGYQLKTGFEAATGGLWPLNVGQVYTTLERLERDGLVVSSESDGQRRFELTDAGHGELGAWWNAVAFDEPPPRDELVLKVLLAIDHGPAHALEVITAQRTALTVLLQRRRRAATAAAGSATAENGPVDGLVTALAHDALVVRAEADLRWLDLCEARVRAAEPKETPQ